MNRRICGAITHSPDRHPCRRALAAGYTRCDKHGGRTPLAEEKAREVLLEARGFAARALNEVLGRWLQGPRCRACGRPDRDMNPVVKAALGVLDRTGFGPSSTLWVAQTRKDPDLEHFVNWMTEAELDQVTALMARAKARMAAGEPPLYLPPAIGAKAVRVADDSPSAGPEGTQP